MPLPTEAWSLGGYLLPGVSVFGFEVSGSPVQLFEGCCMKP